MNMKQAIASVASLVAASASFASSIDFPDFSNVVSAKSRAEVIAELNAARASGMTLDVRDGQYPVITQHPGAQKSREEVLAELKQFQAEHPNFVVDRDYPAAFGTTPMKPRLAGTEMSSSGR